MRNKSEASRDTKFPVMRAPESLKIDASEEELSRKYNREIEKTNRTSDLGLSWLGLIVLLVLYAFIARDFYTQDNWLSTSLYASSLLMLVAGQEFVIVTGGIDLSDGAILGFSSMAAAMLMARLWANGHGSEEWVSILVGVAIALGCGISAGVFNGLVIAKLRVPPFIVTLGSLGMVGAAIDLLNAGQSQSSLPPAIGDFGSDNLWGWIPWPFLVAVILVVIVGAVLRWTKFGWHIYAIGSNSVAATRAGIPIDRRIVVCYAISGFLAAIGGILLMAQFAEASNSAGSGDELTAIAAVVIGGTSLFGGRGTMFGAVIGTAIISVLVTGLVLAGVSPFWQPFATGAVLIVAVLFEIIRDERSGSIRKVGERLRTVAERGNVR